MLVGLNKQKGNLENLQNLSNLLHNDESEFIKSIKEQNDLQYKNI